MLTGILLKIASAFVFTLMSASVKLSASTYPIAELVFFRSFFALVVLMVWLMARSEFPHGIGTRRPLGHLGRALAGSGGMFCGFVSLSLLPLPDATALGFTTPLIVVMLAALVLKEHVRLYRWSAVAVGFGGVMVMLSGHISAAASADFFGSRTGTGVLVALTAAIFSAIATIQTRRLTASERTGAIVFYFTLTTTILGAAGTLAASLWPQNWPGASVMASQAFVAPPFKDFLALAAIGFFGGIGQILLTECYRYADASIIACFDYTAMLWASLLGFFLFEEVPSSAVITGAAIVAMAGVFVIWRERRLGLRRAQERAANTK